MPNPVSALPRSAVARLFYDPDMADEGNSTQIDALASENRTFPPPESFKRDALVVDTLDRNRMKMTDRFELLDNGRVLERTITLRSEDGETDSLVQQYGRVD